MNEQRRDPFVPLEQRAQTGDAVAMLDRAQATVRTRRRRLRVGVACAVTALVAVASVALWPDADGPSEVAVGSTDDLGGVSGGSSPVGPVPSTTSGRPTTGEESTFVADPCAVGDERFERAQFAFAGVVTAIERRVNPRDVDPENPDFDPSAEPPLVPWVTFDVDAWFTDDRGEQYRAWMPDPEPVVGQALLVAGDSFAVDLDTDGALSGQVDPCLAEPATAEAAATWGEVFGGSVEPGVGLPEGPVDPAAIARIDAALAAWQADEPSRYSVTIVRSYDGGPAPLPGQGCTEVGASRITVEDGVVVDAFNQSQHCRYAPGLAPTVAEVFARARELTGAAEFSFEAGGDGNLVDWYAYDRSVNESGIVSDLVVDPGELEFGTDPVPLDENPYFAAWLADPIDDYELVVERRCLCAGERLLTVSIVDGVPVEAVDEGGRPVETGGETWDPRTVDELYALLAGFVPDLSVELGGSPTGGSRWVAEYDASGRWPVRLSLDPIVNAIDDELELVVTLTPR